MNTTPADMEAAETETEMEPVEPRPLRSMEDLLDERLDQRETADVEEAEAEDEIGETRSEPRSDVQSAGGKTGFGEYTEEGAEISREKNPEAARADDEELPSGSDQRSSAFRDAG